MAEVKETEIKVKVDSTQAAKSLNNLRDEWKAAEKAANNAAVGTAEYAKAQQEAANKKSAYEGAKNDAAELRKENQSLVESFGKFTPASGIIGDFSNKFQEAKGAIGNVISSMGTLKGAIAATGIGLLVLAMGALFAWIQKTDSGAKFLEGTLNALGNIVDNLSGRLMKLVTGDFEGAFKDLGTDLLDSAKAGYELANAMDEIDSKTREVNEANSEVEKQVDILLAQTKNRAKSEKEKLDLLDQASKLEENALKRTIELQAAKLKAVDAEIKQAEKIAGANEVSDDLLNKRSALIVEKNNLERESLTLQEKIENRRAQLLEQEMAEREKLEAARAKQIEDAIKLEQQKAQEIEKALLQARKLEEDYVNFRNSLINDSFDQERAKRLTEYDRQRQDLQEKGFLDAEAIKAMDAQLALDLEAIELARKESKLATQLANIEEENNLRIGKLDELLLTQSIKEDEFNMQRLEASKEAIKAKMKALEDAGKQETSQYQKLKNESIKTDNDIKASRLAALQTQNAAFASSVSTWGNMLSNAASSAMALSKQETDSKIANFEAASNRNKADLKAQLDQGIIDKATYEKKVKEEDDRVRKKKNELIIEQFNSEKILKISQATMAGGLAAIQALAQLGPIAGAIAAGVVAVTTGINIAMISSQKPPTFAKKGAIITNGSKHGLSYGDAGIALIDRISGTEIGEMENEEMILTAGVYRNPTLRAAASRLNVMGGGRALYEEGGVVNTAPSPQTPSFNFDVLTGEIRMLRADLNKYQNNFKVSLIYSELEDFSKKVELVKT